jgi:hypothetical protein
MWRQNISLRIADLEEANNLQQNCNVEFSLLLHNAKQKVCHVTAPRAAAGHFLIMPFPTQGTF